MKYRDIFCFFLQKMRSAEWKEEKIGVRLRENCEQKANILDYYIIKVIRNKSLCLSRTHAIQMHIFHYQTNNEYNGKV